MKHATLILPLLLAGSIASAGEHWSFQALRKPAEPAVKQTDWPRNAIDRFILAKLEAQDLVPAAPADRSTLLRRATFDLTGLPPTPEELDAFLHDPAPDAEAYGKVIDRLLASPHYGEHWGRHWLDVARFVQGTVKVPGIDRIDMAEPYRDYVVRAFNQDKPYARFLTEQIAGDLLPAPADPSAYLDQIIAPAFLSIGPWFDECTDPNKLRLDIVDEQMTTLGQAALGLNFNCARCHDHKFDPIPTRDYYGLAGIFRSTRITERFSDAWRDGRPRLAQPLATPERVAADTAIRAAMDSLRAERDRILVAERERILAETAARNYEKALASWPQPARIAFEAEDFAGQLNLKTFPVSTGEVIGTRTPLEQWVRYEFKLPKAAKYALELRYASAEPTPVEIELNDWTVTPAWVPPVTGGSDEAHLAWVKVGEYDFKAGTNELRLEAPKNKPFPRLDAFQLVPILPTVTAPDGLDAAILNAMTAKRWPPSIPETERLASPAVHGQLAAVDARISQLGSQLERFEMALGVKDELMPQDLAVRPGGNVYQEEGAPVPRHVPSFADSLVKRPEIPRGESGRVQLAQWLTDPAHPLTARVMANRVWHWHFGRGIVATPGDLGTQGGEPSHPELLDWLAATLIEQGWSVKSLQRLILTSRVYQLSSAADTRQGAIDPDARLYGRYRPRALEAECVYDAMLSASGKFVRQASGQPLDVTRSKDRALYILTSARSPVGLGAEIRKMFALFGYDASGLPLHQRDPSRTSAQALWWLNNPLPKYYADKLAERLLAMPDMDDEERVAALFRLTLGDAPSAELRGKTLRYLAALRTEDSLSAKEAWSRVCLGVFSSEKFGMLQ